MIIKLFVLKSIETRMGGEQDFHLSELCFLSWTPKDSSLFLRRVTYYFILIGFVSLNEPVHLILQIYFKNIMFVLMTKKLYLD